jgi:predicted lipoprotein with Yx(FWY)xxD motif
LPLRNPRRRLLDELYEEEVRMGLRSLRVRVTAIALVTGFGVAAAVAGAAPTALVTVKSTQNAALGKILVNGSGKTLYHYASEKKNAVKCTGSCARTWPPLLIGAGAKPVAAPGVTASLLGTVKRPDGKLQVTYKGLALYLYAGDKKAGDVKGQGTSGIWHAIAPSGVVVKKAATTTGTSTGSGAGSGSSGGSGGSGSSGSGSGSGTGSTGGGGGGGGGGGTGEPADCAANPGGYGCM